MYLADNNKASAEKLTELAKKNKIKMPLSVNLEGKKAPKQYELNPKVKYTVIVYEKKKCIKTFALNKITEKDVKAVLAAAGAAS